MPCARFASAEHAIQVVLQRAGAAPAARHLHGSGDSRDGIAQLVRDLGDDLSQRGELLRPAQLLLDSCAAQ